MKDWQDIPPNAQTIRTVESCLDRLYKSNPYPPNMKPDRKNFAVARLGYSAAVYELEKYMCELTEDLEIEAIEIGDKFKYRAASEAGCKCMKCDTGRIALVSSEVYMGTMDDEPYVSGEKDGNNDIIDFQDGVWLSIHACDHCGHVYSVFVNHVEETDNDNTQKDI